MFVRVRDKETRHEFDLPETDPRIGVSVDLLNKKQFPPARFSRPAKHYAPAKAVEKKEANLGNVHDSQHRD